MDYPTLKRIILLALFALGLFVKLRERFRFEQEKKDHSAQFIRLYRENNLIYIIILLYLCVKNTLELLGYEDLV